MCCHIEITPSHAPCLDCWISPCSGPCHQPHAVCSLFVGGLFVHVGEKDGQEYVACCLPDRYIQMDLLKNVSDLLQIPAIFVSASGALTLMQALAEADPVHIRAQDIPHGAGWLASAFLIWVLGCFVEILASWTAARPERARMLAVCPG